MVTAKEKVHGINLGVVRLPNGKIGIFNDDRDRPGLSFAVQMEPEIALRFAKFVAAVANGDVPAGGEVYIRAEQVEAADDDS